MNWIAPSEKDADNAVLEKRFWDTGTKAHELGRRRLNLAVHGLLGEIKHGGNINIYYDATGRFGFVLANGSMSSQPVR